MKAYEIAQFGIDELSLVEREMPEVDVARLQRRVGGRRPRWEYADRA